MKPCKLWTGRLSDNGYGLIMIDGKYLRVHRRSWEQTYGVIPTGMNVLHKCDVRNCYEPEHLFLGTQLDNVADMMRKGRHAAKLTDEQAMQVRHAKGLLREIAARFDISVTHVSNLKNGKRR